MSNLILLLIVVLGFAIRVVFQLDEVFVNWQGQQVVWFRGVDSWYHMRLADTLLNAKTWITTDNYSVFGHLVENGYRPLLEILIVSISVITKINYEVVAAYLPPIFGSIIIIVVYLLGREYFPQYKSVALIAAFLVAIIPGELLHRTLLGFTDHHFLEVLWSSLLILLLPKSLNFGRYTLVSSLVLFLYCFSWVGVGLFILPISAWLCIIIFLRRTNYKTSIPSLIAIAVPSIILTLLVRDYLTIVALLMGLLIAPGFAYLLSIRRNYIIYSIIGVISLGTLWYAKDYLPVFWGGLTNIGEAQPLKIQEIFYIYGITCLLFLGGLLYYFRYQPNKSLLLVVWGIFLFGISIGQRRWGYYSTIPIALFSSYFIVILTQYLDIRVRRVGLAVVILFVIAPLVGSTVGVAKLPNNITESWYTSLVWLRNNTPEPFENSQLAYNSNIHQTQKYGVLAWWDYGHWIIRIAKRIPISSPTNYGNDKYFAYLYGIDRPDQLDGIEYLILDEKFVEDRVYALSDRLGFDGLKDLRERYITRAKRIWDNNGNEEWTLVYHYKDIKIFQKSGS